MMKTDDLTGTFYQSGYVKAMWWASLDNIMPLCDAEPGKDLKVTAK